MSKRTTTRATESELLAKYPHLVPNTLAYISPFGGCDNAAVPEEILSTHRNKQVCQIATRGINGDYDCNYRWIASSDLHQVFHTAEVKAQLDKAKRNTKAKVDRLLAKMETVTA